MMGLSNRVALVTGGASGIGKAIAQRLALHGARVVITDIDVHSARAVATEHSFTSLRQDVTSEEDWQQVVGEVEARLGQLDILVNNAGALGSLELSSPESTPYSDWKKSLMVNLDSVFLGCKAAIPAMRRGGGTGAIINISSVAGLSATPHATAYGASKAAVRQLTRSIAQYCAQEGLKIRCNSVHPGEVRTPLRDKVASEMAVKLGLTLEQSFERTRISIPMREWLHPEDVASVVAFLASEEARYITGEKFVVDGGLVSCSTFRFHTEAVANTTSATRDSATHAR